MKYLSLLVGACAVSVGFLACSSDDSGGGGTGGSGAAAAGGFGAGGAATGGVGAGGAATGGTGAVATGGTGAVGGGAQCPANLQGQKCNALQTNVPAETACIQGQCCSLVDACLADPACSSFVACGSVCLQGGGTPQSCGQQCQSCLGSSQAMYTAFTDCVQTCAGGDGGTADGGVGDAATD